MCRRVVQRVFVYEACDILQNALPVYARFYAASDYAHPRLVSLGHYPRVDRVGVQCLIKIVLIRCTQATKYQFTGSW